jgi:hypothetical protein
MAECSWILSQRAKKIGGDNLLALPARRRHIARKSMLAFLFKVWSLAKPYRVRLFLSVVTGVASGVYQNLYEMQFHE